MVFLLFEKDSLRLNSCCNIFFSFQKHCPVSDFAADYYGRYPEKAATVESFLFSKV